MSDSLGLTRLRTLAENAAEWVQHGTGHLDGERAYQEWVETYGSHPEACLALLDRLDEAQRIIDLETWQTGPHQGLSWNAARRAWLAAVDRAEGETPDG